MFKQQGFKKKQEIINLKILSLYIIRNRNLYESRLNIKIICNNELFTR